MRDAIQMQIENNQVTSIVRSQIANYIQGVKATLKHPVQTQCLKMSHFQFGHFVPVYFRLQYMKNATFSVIFQHRVQSVQCTYQIGLES